jgi:hypothetical protein
MEYLDQPTAAETGLPTENSLWGHRKGDAILLAWNYARERGDLEAAAQLHLEYEKIVNESPPTVSVDRREKTRGIYGVLVGFWASFMRF